MRIGLQTWGSDGDIRPFLALGAALADAGHEVTLGITSVDGKDYSALGARLGIAVEAVGRFPYDADRAQEMGRRMRRLRNPMKQLGMVLETFFNPVAAQMFAYGQELCRKHDLVIGHVIVHPLAAAADAAGVPHVQLSPLPLMVSTGSAPPLGMPDTGWYGNRAAWWLTGHVMNWMLRKQVNLDRAQLALPPIGDLSRDLNDTRALCLLAHSPSLFPTPDDWPDGVVATGDLHLTPEQEGLALDGDLERFLSNGDVPIYIGFGSMDGFADQPAEQLEMITAACRMVGVRAVVQSDWPELQSPDPDRFHIISGAPHDLLFPRCRLLVHHGGAGTSHTACRVGIPSLVVPHLIDQGFWGRMLQRRGVAPEPIDARRLSAPRLATAIERVLGDPVMAERASALGAEMRTEHGARVAVGQIERLLGQ